jgi:hypothetical protein
VQSRCKGAEVQIGAERCRDSAEIHQRCRGGAGVGTGAGVGAVQVHSRCTAGAQQVHSRCTAGAKKVQRCRGAEVLRCRSAEVQRCCRTKCKEGAEVQRYMCKGAKVQRCRRGADEVQVQVQVQRFCRGSAEVQQRFSKCSTVSTGVQSRCRCRWCRAGARCTAGANVHRCIDLMCRCRTGAEVLRAEVLGGE